MSITYAAYDNVLRDDTGRAIVNAEIYVYYAGTGTLAQLYDLAGNPVGQPLSTDQHGGIDNGSTHSAEARQGFRAPGGRYLIRSFKNGVEGRRIPQVMIGTAQAYDAEDLISATGNVYASVADGLAATDEGGFFWVATGEAEGELLTLYRKQGGVAQEIGNLATSGLIRQLAEQAEQAVEQAEQAVEEARYYRDQTATFGGYYADTAAGIAGTTDGQIFSVANDPDPGKITVYRNNAGSADVVMTYVPATGTAAKADVGEAPDQVPTNEIIASTLARDVYSLYGYGMELIAHRGFRGQAPQNTLLAMTTALARGADSLECDVQPSADGIFYLFHDVVVDELTNGTGTFTSLDSSYIDGLTFTATAGTPFADLRISKFTDFLAFAKRRGVYVYAEIKSKRTDSDVDLVVQAIVDAGMSEYCMVQSFHQADLERVRSLNKRIGIGLLGSSPSDYQTQVDNLAALGRGCLLWEYPALLSTPEIIEYCASKNVDIGTWTVNSSVDAEKLLALGVRRIMSDISLEV